jgi:hypothetical protein
MDRQLIDCLHRISQELSLSSAQFYFHAFDGGPSETIPFQGYEEHKYLKVILPLHECSLQSVALLLNNHHLLSVRRKGDSLFDEATISWSEGRHGLDHATFGRLIAIAKRELKEVKIGEAFKGFPNAEINSYYEARDATLTRLETVSSELLFNTQRRLAELDAEFQKRVAKLDQDVAAQRAQLQSEFDAKDTELKQRDEAIKTRESEFETRESKYLRRGLRKEMLERLTALSQKFELTQGTRQLRWPVAIFTIILMAFFATMTVLSFTQTGAIIKTAGEDISKLSWWQVGFLGFKQLGFAAAFLGGAWFFIKWNDRWFRQHADAEFMFKQLELDINRASWVVEMALEWKDEQGLELPPELLERLTRNLFKQSSQDSDGIEAPPDLASVLLGSAATLKIKAPSGAEVELDRKGLKNALKQTQE